MITIKKNILLYWVVGILIVIASARGFLIIHFDFPSSLVYKLSAICLTFLALYGFLKKGLYVTRDFVLLRNILLINMILGGVNIAIDIILGNNFTLNDYISLYYLFFAPYAIFLFLTIPSNYLKWVIIIISILISYSVIDNFLSTQSGEAGILSVKDYNLKLRSSFSGALSRSGIYFRASGYTGNYHDSANILGMVAVFFSTTFIINRGIGNFALFIISMLALSLTQSAANIIIFIFVILSSTCYVFLKNRNIVVFLYIVIGAILTTIVILNFWDTVTIFFNRATSNESWGSDGMLTQLDSESLISAIPYMITGHARALGSPSFNNEVALYGQVLQLGFIHAIIFFSLLLYPFWAYKRLKSICYDAVPALTAIAFGFLSLAHYGSLFRVTSIYLFFVFYSIALIKIHRAGIFSARKL